MAWPLQGGWSLSLNFSSKARWLQLRAQDGTVQLFEDAGAAPAEGVAPVLRFNLRWAPVFPGYAPCRPRPAVFV
jgi:hypothetical protein